MNSHMRGMLTGRVVGRPSFESVTGKNHLAWLIRGYASGQAILMLRRS